MNITCSTIIVVVKNKFRWEQIRFGGLRQQLLFCLKRISVRKEHRQTVVAYCGDILLLSTADSLIPWQWWSLRTLVRKFEQLTAVDR
jgi:hypothetical protein